MRAPTIADPFFTGKALVLVEDPLTQRVLTALWSVDPQAKSIDVRSVGGKVAVERLVTAAREQGRTSVFGLVDRDFSDSTSAFSAWPKTRTDWHEIENHLLDFEALAALTRRDFQKTAQELRDIAETRARELQGWMASRLLLNEIKRDLSLTPAEPVLDAIATLADAQTWIGGTKYPDNVAKTAKLWTPLRIKARLADLDEACAAQIANGTWRERFSGKEIFSTLRSKVAWRPPVVTNDDLAWEVARRWQRGDQPTPPFFVSLRDRVIADAKL